MSKLKFIDKWNKFCQIPECHYLCDRISGTSDYGLGCPRLEKGYLVRIALFFFLFLRDYFSGSQKYTIPIYTKKATSFRVITHDRDAWRLFLDALQSVDKIF